MTRPTEDIRSPEAMVNQVLDFVGMRRCPHNTDTTRVLWCMCNPGECQQKASDGAWEAELREMEAEQSGDGA